MLRARAERREQARVAALRKIAPGFEPQGAPLLPDRVASVPVKAAGEGADDGDEQRGQGHERQRSVLDDLVDHLAALDASSEKNA